MNLSINPSMNPSVNPKIGNIIKSMITTNKSIEICMCSDMKFLKPTLISINSLLCNTKYPHNLININLVIENNTLSEWEEKIKLFKEKKNSDVNFNIKEFIPPNNLKILLNLMKSNTEIRKFLLEQLQDEWYDDEETVWIEGGGSILNEKNTRYESIKEEWFLFYRKITYQ